jgi:SAM-dependent methyltransferase
MDMFMTASNTRDVFTTIYHENFWESPIKSGPGSAPELARGYCELLQRTLRELRIATVVDLGCGDWSFSRLIDWSGIDYTGIDVVPELIEELNTTYGRNRIRFLQGDLLTCDLPQADLAIAKDVLQHWPNEMIAVFLQKLNQFRYAILTNDRKVIERRGWRSWWRKREVGRANENIPIGGFRPLRLREAPFNLQAAQLTTIPMPHQGKYIHVKEVLLWQNPVHIAGTGTVPVLSEAQ